MRCDTMPRTHPAAPAPGSPHPLRVLAAMGLLAVAQRAHPASAFSPCPAAGGARPGSLRMADAPADTTWTNLVPADESAPVRKTVLEDGKGGLPKKGQTATIQYTGRLVLGGDSGGLAVASWTPGAVVDCWLAEQQGLSGLLEGPFAAQGVDGAFLLDGDRFTEDFLLDPLGLENKLQRKKAVMAARRLRTSLEGYEDGAVFDSSSDKEDGVFRVAVGAGKTIKAVELLVASMAVGERARVRSRCDYGYGSEGYRTSRGDVVVPPFCGLEFEVELVSLE